MKRKLIFFSSFNRTMFPHMKKKGRPHPSLTLNWMEPRFKIWNKYTWNSIQRQEYEDWNYIVCCYPDKKAMEYTDEAFNAVKDERFILSYSYTDAERKLISDIASKYDEIILVRLDSDDMYHPLAAKELMEDKVICEWYFWLKGYCYIYCPTHKWENGKMFIWKCSASGPFYAHRMKSAQFAKKDMIKEISHRKVIRFGPRKLTAGRFMVGIHGNNTSSTLKSKTVRQKLFGENKIKILREYGIWPEENE